MNFTTSYRNKKVFLTGHTGFKGAWMSVWLDQLGAHVKGYALKPERNSLYDRIAPSLRKHESVIADIRDGKRLKKELLSFQPDFIFHMAAQALVRESYRSPVETLDVNAMGTAILLDALRDLKKTCCVVIVTTDKVYENPETGKPFSENDPLGGHDPYSASKAAAEIVAASFRLSFFPPKNYSTHKKSIASARAGNVIGGGDYAADRIVPDIYRALSKKQPIPVRNPTAIRPWQHVLEPLSGYLQLGTAMKNNPVKFSTAFNFGPVLSDTLPVKKLVELSLQNWGSGSYRIIRDKQAPHEAQRLILNIEKARRILHWTPTWNASRAIAHSMEWYKQSRKKNANAFDLCLADILSFSAENKIH